MTTSPCYCTRTRHAAGALKSLYDAALAPVGFSVAQFSLMRNIGRLAEPHLSALAAATGLDRSTIGRNLRLLASIGVVRLEEGRDHRSKVVRLTEAGTGLIDPTLPRWRSVQEEVGRRLGPERCRQLFELPAEKEGFPPPSPRQPSVLQTASGEVGE